MSHLTMRSFCAAAVMAVCPIFSVNAAPQPDMTGVVKETYDYAVKDGDTLRLDIYYNPDIDYPGPRPVIIFSFGGGWEAGARADGAGSFTPFLNTMTRYGYIGVGIDYRLGYLDSRKTGKVDDVSICDHLVSRKIDRNIFDNVCNAITMAVEDIFDATNFVVNNARRWNADPQCVIISGISAGGVNSLTAENMLANGDPTAVDRLPAGFRYAGVISGCGAIWHDCDRPVEWLSSPCPVMFIHGDSDTIVPYDRLADETLNYSIDGSRRLSEYFRDNGLPYMLVTGRGGYHPYGGDAFAFDHDLINRFITDFIIKKRPLSVEMTEIPL